MVGVVRPTGDGAHLDIVTRPAAITDPILSIVAQLSAAGTGVSDP